MVHNGIDRPDVWRKLLRGKRVGLVTAASGYDASLRRSVDCLLAEGMRVTALFAPEHGLRGAADAGEDVGSAVDPRTGLPVYSLYRKESRRFTENMFRDVDVITYDIADVGARFYTYLSTLLTTVEDCARFHRPLVVLDRVNPLGGSVTEGAALQPDCRSFVGAYDVPIRYAMTPGEFALLVNHEERCGCDLTVVEATGWRRNWLHPQTGLPWVPPSPALQHFESALLYPGTCLAEGANLSEGRGTAAPFALIGAPYVNADTLSDRLNAQTLPGVRFLSAAFTPSTSKHAGVPCEGVRILLTDAHACRPVTVGLAVLDAVRGLWPESFAFLPPAGESGLPMIDLLSGSHRLREGQTAAGYLADAAADCETFLTRSTPFQLYKGD